MLVSAPYGFRSAICGVIVHWLAVEAGTYDAATYGMKMEASTVTSTVTDIKGRWVG